MRMLEHPATLARNEVRRAHRQRYAARHASVVGPEQQHQHRDDRRKAGSQRRNQHQGQQNDRNGQRYVHRPHYERIKPRPEKSGGDTQGGTNRTADEYRDGGHYDGNPGAVDNSAQDIPAKIIGSQQEGRRPSGNCDLFHLAAHDHWAVARHLHSAAVHESLGILQRDLIGRASAGGCLFDDCLELDDLIAVPDYGISGFDTRVPGVHQRLRVLQHQLRAQVRPVGLIHGFKRADLGPDPHGGNQPLRQVSVLGRVRSDQRCKDGRDDHHDHHNGHRNYRVAPEQFPDDRQLLEWRRRHLCRISGQGVDTW